MAKTYQEKMYDDYKRTHPTWHRDVKTQNTQQKKTVDWKAPGGNKPTEKRVLNVSKPRLQDTYPTQKGTANNGVGGTSRRNTKEKRQRTSQLMRSLPKYGK